MNMDGFTITILIILIITTIGFVYINIYNKFQILIIKINEAESKIDTSLRERYDLLSKASTFIKEKINEDVMLQLSDIDTSNISNFDFDRKLSEFTKEFYEMKFNNRDLVKIDHFTDIDFELRENEASLEGYISYYNDNISKYNKYFRVFPSNLIAKISRYKEKTFYDGKNMNDKNINDFKI
jgi:LemA protein